MNFIIFGLITTILIAAMVDKDFELEMSKVYRSQIFSEGTKGERR